MKSLLVDVLRQAKDGSPTQTLSDSGSFDATQNEIAETANDAVVTPEMEPSAEELKLYETSASIDATFDLPANEDAMAPAGDDILPDVAAAPAVRATHARPDRQVAASGAAPALARFSPLICISAAFLAAVVWIGYQQLMLKVAASDIAAAQVQARGEQAIDIGNTSADAATQRFPFIGAGTEPIESGSDE